MGFDPEASHSLVTNGSPAYASSASFHWQQSISRDLHWSQTRDQQPLAERPAPFDFTNHSCQKDLLQDARFDKRAAVGYSAVHVCPPPHITPAFLSLVVLPKAHEPNAIQTRLLGMCRCGQFLVRGMATLGLLTEHEASMSCHAMPCHIMDPARSCEISLASAGRHPAPSFFGQLRMPRSWLGPDDSIQKSRPLPNEASA